MAYQETSVPVHWNYFLSIDNDLLNLSRYVEFTEENFDSYSIEQVRILLSTSSEVDVISKLLCKRVNRGCVPRTIIDYQKILSNTLEQFDLPEINEIVVKIPRFGLTFQPWELWRFEETSPLWWRAHTDVKHERDINFYQANLKNTLNSAAALFVLLIVYYRILTQDGLYPMDGHLFARPALFHDNMIFYG